MNNINGITIALPMLYVSVPVLYCFDPYTSKTDIYFENTNTDDFPTDIIPYHIFTVIPTKTVFIQYTPYWWLCLEATLADNITCGIVYAFMHGVY